MPAYAAQVAWREVDVFGLREMQFKKQGGRMKAKTYPAIQAATKILRILDGLDPITRQAALTIMAEASQEPKLAAPAGS